MSRTGGPRPGAHRANARTLEASAVAIYRDAADVLRFGGFRRRYGQYAVPERGGDLVLVDVLQRYASFEAAIDRSLKRRALSSDSIFFSPAIERTPFAISRLTSFSSRPGNSAVMR